MNRRIAFAGLCAALLVPSAASAQNWRETFEQYAHGPHRDHKKVLREIGLSPEKIKEVETMHFEAEQQRVDIDHELKKARLSLHQLLAADAPDEAAVFAQIDKIGAIDARMKKNRLGLLLKVRKLMTPAQWEKFQAARPHHRFGFRRHGPMPPVPPIPPVPPLPPPRP